jgi:hypothetical protein
MSKFQNLNVSSSLVFSQSQNGLLSRVTALLEHVNKLESRWTLACITSGVHKFLAPVRPGDYILYSCAQFL